MTALAAQLRRLHGVGVPFLPRSRLVRDLLLSHLAVAAAVIVFLLADPLSWRLALSEVAALGTVALAAGAGVGLAAARRVAGALVDLLRLVESPVRLERREVQPLPTTPRHDEIGYLSSALGRLVAELADRAAANEEFAADVSHEIRNPLASLRSAAESLRQADDAQRGKLLEIIAEDVARLDRLVGEITSASRLDAELVREEAATFDLVETVRNLAEHLARGARGKGVEVVPDLPNEAICLAGLEARLAQVVVNVVENAISLCEDGDAIRIWTRRRDREVVLVVEDTGPGIPEGAGDKIFRRFYSHRPGTRSSENSGLGLAISRQIVEAHGGMIWAENIRPTESDLLSEPLGARFVVVLPL